jgi:lipopolysaccharide export system permease protein
MMWSRFFSLFRASGIAERYVAWQMFRMTLLVMSGFLGLFWFFGVLDRLSLVGVADYKIQTLLMVTGLELPSRFYTMLPIAVLIGILVALTGLSKTSELIVLRTSGLSKELIIRWVSKFAFQMGVLGFLVGNWLVPVCQNLAEDTTKTALHRDLNFSLKSGIWLRESYVNPSDVLEGRDVSQSRVLRFINVGGVNQQKELQRIRIYEFTTNFLVSRIIDAKTAIFDQRSWLLKDVKVIGFDVQAGEAVAKTDHHFDELFWVTDLDEKLILSDRYSAEDTGVWDLWKQKEYLEANGQDNTKQTLNFWKKLFSPFSVLALAFCVFPFLFVAHSRNQYLAFRVFVGALVGLSFFTVQGLVGYVATLRDWPIPVALMFPNVVLLVSIYFFCTKIQRG